MSLSVGSAAPAVAAGSSAAIIAMNAVHVPPNVIISNPPRPLTRGLEIALQSAGQPRSVACPSLRLTASGLDPKAADLEPEGGRIYGEAPGTIGAKGTGHHGQGRRQHRAGGVSHGCGTRDGGRQR